MNGEMSGRPKASPVNIEAFLPKYDDDTDLPLPNLSENPTHEELLAFAHAHPIIKHAIRTFRAKIVEIKKISN